MPIMIGDSNDIDLGTNQNQFKSQLAPPKGMVDLYDPRRQWNIGATTQTCQDIESSYCKNEHNWLGYMASS